MSIRNYSSELYIDNTFEVNGEYSIIVPNSSLFFTRVEVFNILA